MTVNEDYLLRLGRAEDPHLGIVEEFLTLRHAGTDVLAVLTRPVDRRGDLGWVICPSVGQERRNLRRLESLVARDLAAAGSPVLRIRGSFESARTARSEASLGSRIAEAKEAVAFTADATGVDRIGVAGALLGGAVAALVAESLQLPQLALWQPVVSGRQYMRESLRLQRISELVGMTNGEESSAEALDDLRRQGWTTIRGFRVTQHAYDEISAVDLAQDVRSFRGNVLIVSISSNGRTGSPTMRLAERFRECGATVTVAGLVDPLETPFGEYYYRDVGVDRADTRLELDRQIAHVTTNWATSGDSRGELPADAA